MSSQNGNGSTDGTGAGGFDLDAALPALVELGKIAVAEVAAGRMGWDEALLMMADAGGNLGYRQGQADLMARFVPVRFGKDATGKVALEGEEAAAVLRDFGLLPE